MRQELTSALRRTCLIVEPNLAEPWIDVVWMGYLTGDNIRTGAAAYTAALAASRYHAVLNDTRRVGSVEHSLDWVVNTWAPQAAAAGLTLFAMVTTRESMADATAMRFYQQLTAFQAEVFADVEEARRWLRQFSLAAGER